MRSRNELRATCADVTAHGCLFRLRKAHRAGFERAIRPQTITRKNALFAGSHGGGRTWATIATLLQTAKMNDVDPLAWLAQTLERIANRWPISQIVGIDFDTTVEEEAPKSPVGKWRSGSPRPVLTFPRSAAIPFPRA